jgi:hypothetical protein
VHQVATAADDDAGWRTVASIPASDRRVNLLTLTNGVIKALGEAELPAGTYTQLRLILDENTGGSPPFANSVVPTGGSEQPLQTPSGQQSGLKLNVDITVPAGQVADVVLDFDACKSVVRAGNSGRYLLKPVVSVLPVLSDAGTRIVGYVDPAMATGATSITAQQQGRVIRATPPMAASGRFVLYPLPEGAYDLVVTAPGRATAVITGVPVQLATPSVVSTASAPISPPASASRAVSGTVAVLPPGSPNLSSVRALQTLTGGVNIEVAARPVDADTGAYTLTLPLGAARRAPFVESPTALALAADASPPGRYTVEAAAPGIPLPKLLPVDLNVVPVPALDFVFP